MKLCAMQRSPKGIHPCGQEANTDRCAGRWQMAASAPVPVVTAEYNCTRPLLDGASHTTRRCRGPDTVGPVSYAGATTNRLLSSQPSNGRISAVHPIQACVCAGDTMCSSRNCSAGKELGDASTAPSAAQDAMPRATVYRGTVRLCQQLCSAYVQPSGHTLWM